MAFTKIEKYNSTHISLAVFACVCAVLLAVIIFERHSAISYNESVSQAKDSAIQLTQVVTEKIQISLLAVDQIIRRSVERQHFNTLFGGNLTKDMENNLKLWSEEIPYIKSMLLTDENGVVTMLHKRPDANVNIVKSKPFIDKQHIDQHINQPINHLLITPFNGGTNRFDQNIIVSRKFENIDGSFGGLVAAVIDGDYLINSFRSLEPAQDSHIVLLLGSREFLIRSADIATSNAIRSRYDQTQLTKSGQVDVLVHQQKQSDNVAFTTFGLINNYLLDVAIATSNHESIIAWNLNHSRYFVFMMIFIAFVTTLAIFLLILSNRMKQVKDSEQKALMASQSKTEFLAKMSHELRTPLNAIIGFSEMLSSGCFGIVNKYQKERLRDINMCGNHLMEFVNDILDFSKGEAGKTRLDESNVEVASLISKTLRMVEPKAEAKEIRLINATTSDKTYLYADDRKLKQVALNLLTNAIKFTPKGGRVKISSRIDHDGNFILTVSDTGIGMANEDIPKALRVFEQLSTDLQHEGTGLGLPLCKMFAELHGGKLTIHSKIGVGTRVSVSIPANRIVIVDHRPELEEVPPKIANHA